MDVISSWTRFSFDLGGLFLFGNLIYYDDGTTKRFFHSTRAPTLPIVVICACNDLCPGGECTTRDLTYEQNTYLKTAKVKEPCFVRRST